MVLIRLVSIISLLLLFSENSNSQGCCSGGSGSPIAGGVSQGVLLGRQVEIASNFQTLSTDKFLAGDKDTTKLFDNLSSSYLYTRIAYGFTSKLTVSVETGYFFDKTEKGLHPERSDYIKKSSGISDLVIFPRYDVYNQNEENKRTEITLGLGLKIPLGKYNDSAFSSMVYVDSVTERELWVYLPPAVQPTTGSYDVIFYGFLYRGYPEQKTRFFANLLYIRKGFNPLGQKFGDYASVGLFAGKTFFEKLGVTLQLRGEWIGKIEAKNNLDLLADYNIEKESTGNEKILFVPQVSYSIKKFTFYALTEIPIYQYLNGYQVGSGKSLTLGASYRFFSVKP